MLSEAVPLLNKNNVKVRVVTADEPNFHALLTSAMDLSGQHDIPADLLSIVIGYESQLTPELL
jgi:hypothetical protein